MAAARYRAANLILIAVLGLTVVGCGNSVLVFGTNEDAGAPDTGLDAEVPQCTTPADCPQDGNPCTEAPDCIDGECEEAASADGTSCDDGVFCNGADTCDGSGMCEHAGDPCLGQCDELNDVCAGCGDGLVGPGEQCDPGAPSSQSCCDPATCLWVAAGAADPQSVCLGGAPECQVDVCDGIGGCAIQSLADGTPCTGNGQFCDGVEVCQTGSCLSPGDPCPAGDACSACNEAADSCISPPGTVCRPSIAACDPAEQCDGLNPICPADIISCIELICDDAADNDGDGDTDCADTDCVGSPECTETGPECTDFLDNDGDGATDCADPDCFADPACVPVGGLCSEAIDVTGGPFPWQEIGLFGKEVDPGGSCDPTPNNMVFFSYTAPTTDWYQIDVENHSTTNAYSRLAVFDGTTCNPYGPELDCVTSNTKTATTTLLLTAGQSYLIVFYTDGNSYTMVSPEITIGVPPPPPPGGICPMALDVTGGPFPYQVMGAFDLEADPGGSCDLTPNNMVFFSYTAPTTDWYQINVQNHSTTNAYSRLVVLDGTACNPYDPELECVTSNTKTATTAVLLTAGQDYLIVFYTDGEVYTMVDPEITITPIPTPPPGGTCPTAIDVTGGPFPYQVMGTFDLEADPGGSCDTTPTNMVFFTFTPAVTQSYTIDVVNHSPTNAYSRLAVFGTTACGPYGPQLACVTSNSKTATTTLTLTAGQSYLIVFYTDGQAYTMVDPEITITP